MEEKASILVVEDEAAIRGGLCDVLAFRGHEPTGVESGEEGLRRALDSEWALVMLDIMLPGMSGFEVCGQLRAKKPAQAILMLTARGAEEDILEGFRCGADDYVTKPFSLAELMARVDALLRRTGASPIEATRPFAFGAWQVDPAARTAISDGTRLELSQREVGLLALLAREKGRIVSRRMLLVQVWGMQHVENVQTRTVDVHVAKLRKKLGGGGPIETVRGEGYRFTG